MNLKNAIIISKNMNEYFKRSSWEEGRYYYIKHNTLAESFNKDNKECLMVMEYFEWKKGAFMNRLAEDFDITEVLANDWEIARRNRLSYYADYEEDKDKDYITNRYFYIYKDEEIIKKYKSYRNEKNKELKL